MIQGVYKNWGEKVLKVEKGVNALTPKVVFQTYLISNIQTLGHFDGIKWNNNPP